ncbi:MAG: Gfo/Idh/MocA family oxidoreductase [Verrucomicrobiae bacterium]|nr:Gfo/Idh/MocA family oxidoreductase [Verrucomicrobiae bacterium]
MKSVRLGILGAGGMGTHHAKTVLENKVRGLELAAVCDLNVAAFKLAPELPRFTDPEAFFDAGLMDAVLIATPHYAHTTLGIAALKRGLHVLVEKPISVHKADAERLLAAHRGKKQVFAAMFNQRADAQYMKVRDLVASGELGEVRRMSWIVTDWFRSDAYYASGSWRATWEGEGGGVLLNQCPHQLDLLQWIFGMPKKVRAFCRFGQYHKIAVEDDVTAYLEFPNGATGVFVATTGELPGTNRLEIAAEWGRLILEDGKIEFRRNEIPTTKFCRTTDLRMGAPPAWNVRIPIAGAEWGGQHQIILQNFADAIREGKPLVAPASEGIRSVELGNAMLLSTWLNRTIETPMDGKLFEREIQKRIREERAAKGKGPRAAR